VVRIPENRRIQTFFPAKRKFAGIFSSLPRAMAEKKPEPDNPFETILMLVILFPDI
jgi:hypothetical protein